jgi:hypothetical protein
MANTINELPLVLIDDIISRLHVLSIPHFKASCKVVNNQISTESYDNMVVQHIKGQLENIVNVVKRYHVALTNNDVEERLFKKLLLELNQNRENGRDNYYCVVKMMYYTIRNQTTFRAQRVRQTWIRYINDLPLIDGDDVILDALRRYLIGTDRSVYIVSFNYTENHWKTKSYYCVINLQFHNDGNIKMDYSIEDVGIFRKKVKCCTTGKTLQTSVKSMEIIVNDTTLTELAESILYTLGTETCLSEIRVVNNIDKWIGVFTKFGDKIYDNAINSFVNPTTYRDEIINILS